MEGYLVKRGKLVKSWKVRWFILDNGEVRYYKSQTSRQEKKSVFLNCDSLIVSEPDYPPHGFVMLLVVDSEKQILLSAENDAVKDAWMAAIQREIDKLKVNMPTKTPEKVDIDEIRKRMSMKYKIKSSGKRLVSKTAKLVTSPLKSETEAEVNLSGLDISQVVSSDQQARVKKMSNLKNRKGHGYSASLAHSRKSAQTVNGFADSPPTPLPVEEESSDSEDDEGVEYEEDDEFANEIEQENATLPEKWAAAATADGQIYYYHTETLQTRWDKPCAADESNRERETSDYRQSPKASKAKSPIAVNSKEDVNASEEDSHLRQIKANVERSVNAWKLNAKGIERSFPELLKDIVIILPPDLLMTIYSTEAHKATFDSLMELTVYSNPADVRKLYMRVVRLIHPDKLSAELDKESICMAERVFILMTEKFDIYRRAHGLN